ncbi:MAG: endonuclease/exonuclease/phosphatase family protein [Planctomycetota bacterium]|nr:endonuclease/exonuclease/phosphatase family protein [Planctomycetota bacterium]
MHNTTRRTALKQIAAGSTLLLPSLAMARSRNEAKKIKLGLITDLHGGLAVDADERLDLFLKAMETQKCDALVQLGDFAYPNAKHQTYADKFNAAHDTTIHAIGNHEFDYGLKRKDCFQAWGIDAAYYSKDLAGLNVIVLDGNEKGSTGYKGGYPSYIGEQQLNWLEQELSRSTKPVLILSHQPLAGRIAVDNAAAVQELLSGYKSKIIACLNGHSHVDSLYLERDVPYLHINSASYYWVGGKTRMAYYTKPLFTTVTIDPEQATMEVAPKAGEWGDKSPKKIGYFDRKDAPPEAIVTPQIRNHHISPVELRVMTWNIWGRLNQDPRYTVDKRTARQRTIEIIRESGVDLVAMIETYGSAADIAQALNFHFYTTASDANLCIFSRYPLSDVELLEGLNPFSFIAATVTLPRGQKVRIYDIWLTSGGRHIVEIKNKSVSDEEFTQGDENRHEHLRQLLSHPTFQRDLAASDKIPLIAAGDFNCVSHLDHNTETKQAGLNHSRVLPIAVSKAMAEVGFTDSYRHANPDIKKTTLGHTWTAVGKDYFYESGKGFVKTAKHPRPEYQDPYARIDYIYSKGSLTASESRVIERHHDFPDRQFPVFPSDHAAVATTFRVGS